MSGFLWVQLGILVTTAVATIVATWTSVRGRLRHTFLIFSILGLLGSIAYAIRQDHQERATEKEQQAARDSDNEQRARAQAEATARLEADVKRQLAEAQRQHELLRQFVRVGTPISEVKWTIIFAASDDSAGVKDLFATAKIDPKKRLFAITAIEKRGGFIPLSSYSNLAGYPDPFNFGGKLALRFCRDAKSNSPSLLELHFKMPDNPRVDFLLEPPKRDLEMWVPGMVQSFDLRDPQAIGLWDLAETYWICTWQPSKLGKDVGVTRIEAELSGLKLTLYPEWQWQENEYSFASGYFPKSP